MSRALTIDNIIEKKHRLWQFDGVWLSVFGELEMYGLMLIYGIEKNGKTWVALLLTEMMSRHTKVLYISAEEGTRNSFKQSCIRAKMRRGNRNLLVREYMPIADIDEMLSKRKSPTVVLIDNLTIYTDEFKNGELQRFANRHPQKRIIVLSHEERGEPYPAVARLAKRLSDVYIRVVGLVGFVGGRCPGGNLVIDEQRAQLYHGSSITNGQADGTDI